MNSAQRRKQRRAYKHVVYTKLKIVEDAVMFGLRWSNES